MASEFRIAQGYGLIPPPEQSKPAPADATEARQYHEAGVNEFEELVSRVQTYCDQSANVDVATAAIGLINRAAQLAGDLRQRAGRLKDFPNTFVRVGSQALPFPAIAAAAEQAYRGRLTQLEALEAALGKPPAEEPPPYPLIDLNLHEGINGGHLGREHVARTMEDFKQRWMMAEKRGRGPAVLSAFIADPQLGLNDPRVVQIISRAIHLAEEQIRSAMDGDKVLITINELSDIGFVKERGNPPRFTKFGRIVAFKDSTHPHDLRILTAELGEVYR